MSRHLLEDNKLFDPIIVKGLKLGVHIQTLTGATTLDRDMAVAAFLDPGGATRVVTLPAAEYGLIWLMVNTADAAEDLTIKNAAAATLGTISQNEAAVVISDGTNWYVTLVGTST